MVDSAVPDLTPLRKLSADDRAVELVVAANRLNKLMREWEKLKKEQKLSFQATAGMDRAVKNLHVLDVIQATEVFGAKGEVFSAGQSTCGDGDCG